MDSLYLKVLEFRVKVLGELEEDITGTKKSILMENETFITADSNSESWQATMELRWALVANPDDFENVDGKILQQKWISDKGNVKWEIIETFDFSTDYHG